MMIQTSRQILKRIVRGITGARIAESDRNGRAKDDDDVINP